MQTLIVLACQQMQALNTKLKLMKHSVLVQKKKNIYGKQAIFIYDN